MKRLRKENLSKSPFDFHFGGDIKYWRGQESRKTERERERGWKKEKEWRLRGGKRCLEIDGYDASSLEINKIMYFISIYMHTHTYYYTYTYRLSSFLRMSVKWLSCYSFLNLGTQTNQRRHMQKEGTMKKYGSISLNTNKIDSQTERAQRGTTSEISVWDLRTEDLQQKMSSQREIHIFLTHFSTLNNKYNLKTRN